MGRWTESLSCLPAVHMPVTQVAFKGYEEARVALTCLLFTMPCCIIIGVEYGVFMNGDLKFKFKVRPAAAAAAVAGAAAAAASSSIRCYMMCQIFGFQI